MEAIVKGDEDPILALIVVRLEKLEIFKLHSFFSPFLPRICNTIAKESRTPALSTLNCIEFDSGARDGPPDLRARWFDVIASLPSVNTIKVLSLGQWPISAECALMPHSSNVCSLGFPDCSASSKWIFQSNRAMKGLKDSHLTSSC